MDAIVKIQLNYRGFKCRSFSKAIKDILKSEERVNLLARVKFVQRTLLK